MISSLLVHLDLDQRRADEAIRAIEQEAAIEIGPRHAARLPIVLETETPSESQAITDWLIGLPGVTHVDVTFVHLAPTSTFNHESQTS
ncbi:MAG TPA: hypothetical protein VMM76_15595 [Pirellulaceae bacterium]|nr:hypothetical protein [Pirellulaceae bacterium]